MAELRGPRTGLLRGRLPGEREKNHHLTDKYARRNGSKLLWNFHQGFRPLLRWADESCYLLLLRRRDPSLHHFDGVVSIFLLEEIKNLLGRRIGVRFEVGRQRGDGFRG